MTPAGRHRRRARTALLLLGAQAWVVLLVLPPDVVAPVHHLAHPSCAGSGGSVAIGWAAMVAAMMAPLVVAAVRHVQDRSFPRRRSRSVALFLAGYGACWLVAGAVPLGLLVAVAALPIAPGVALVAALFVTAVWECSPAKQRCLNRTHAHPALRAHGSAADLDAVRFGITHGAWCAGSCWAVMLAALLLPAGHLAAMAAGTAWLAAQRLEGPSRPRWAIRFPRKATRLLVERSRLSLQGVTSGTARQERSARGAAGSSSKIQPVRRPGSRPGSM